MCGSYKTYVVCNLVQQSHPQVAGPLQNFPVSILGLHDALGLGGSPYFLTGHLAQVWPAGEVYPHC